MNKKISPGIYVVVNPNMETDHLVTQLIKIKNENIAAVQIMENPQCKLDKSLLKAILNIFSQTSTPVLINNQWRLCQELAFDGIHFDKLPKNLIQIEQYVGRSLLKGLTLENDLTAVEKAQELGFDYFSFCSLFPSKTSDNCEIVDPNTIVKCRAITSLPVFLAGGITLENIQSLKGLPFDGIAMVSSIMTAEKPKQRLREFNTLLKN